MDQGIFLWLRDALSLIIVYYEWTTYWIVRAEVKQRPIAHLYYVLWAIGNLLIRLVVTFDSRPFGTESWVADHWHEIGLTLGLFFHALGSRDMNRVWTN